MPEKIGKKFLIKCGSKYFDTKYGEKSIIEIRQEIRYQNEFKPATFLFLGRVYAEGRLELFHGKTYYGHMKGLGEGEIVSELELGEEV